MEFILKPRHRFVRFLFVGVLNSAFGYGVFALFIKIGLHYSLATLLGTALGVLFNFFTTGKLVFNSLDRKHLIRFVLVYVLLYFLNIAFLKALITAGMSAYLGGFLLIPIMAVIGYYLQSRFTFRHRTTTLDTPVTPSQQE